MTPLHWLSGGSGNDAGFEDLQTDVMRFMAILAFCLMAVFALVQSLPLAPESPAAPDAATTAPAVAPRATLAMVEPPPQAAGAVAQPVPVATSMPTPAASPPPAAVARSAPGTTPAPVRTAPRPDTEPKPAEPAAADAAAEPEAVEEASDGVTLRFSSDAALRRLVAHGRVGLFAFSEGQSWQLAPSLAEVSFRAANAPGEFHAMASNTVPAAVVAGMTQQTGANSGTLSWGVTLPLPTRYAIARLVREFDSGALIIGADGRVTREAPR